MAHDAPTHSTMCHAASPISMRLFGLNGDAWMLIALQGASREVRALAVAGMLSHGRRVGQDVAATVCQRAWRRAVWISTAPMHMCPGDAVLCTMAPGSAEPFVRGWVVGVTLPDGSTTALAIAAHTTPTTPTAQVTIRKQSHARHTLFFIAPADGRRSPTWAPIRSVRCRRRVQSKRAAP